MNQYLKDFCSGLPHCLTETDNHLATMIWREPWISTYQTTDLSKTWYLKTSNHISHYKGNPIRTTLTETGNISGLDGSTMRISL